MKIYNKIELTKYIKTQKSPKFIFFWSHLESKVGHKAVLSQWYESKFEIDGVVYNSAEQYMMAQKAKLFGDTAIYKKILNANSPAHSKALGREVKGFDENIWALNRFDIVVDGNLAKFTQNIKLKEYLISTKNRILVEASPKDNIWGVGLDENNPNISNPEKWKGLNLLGFALMKVRDILRNNL